MHIIMDSPKHLKIAIIGAGDTPFDGIYITADHPKGMGGLTLALALAKAGFHSIEVYEHAPNLGFVGAGLYGLLNLTRLA